MRSSSARITKLATSDDPPYETNGSVTPVSGITRVTPPMMTNVCTPRIVARPAANSFENGRVGLDRDAERAADEQHERDDDRDGAEQAELLADGGEDEVGGRVSGSVAGCRARGRCPANPPLPNA